MCLDPVLLPNGVEVACHRCWQCVTRRVSDWTGRCIAESHTAVATTSVTLTYGADALYHSKQHVGASVLTYSDVQRFLRALRNADYPVRYFLCGEYGSRKGRAHWHCILFWGKRVPVVEFDRRTVEVSYWPHGHTFWTKATPETVRYVTKYVTKEAESDERDYHLGMSRKPPLGAEYFRQLAAKYVEARLAPQDFFYEFPDVRDAKGKKIQYQLQGVSRRLFLKAFLEGWWSTYGDHPPNSELVDAYEDAEAARVVHSFEIDRFATSVKRKRYSGIGWLRRK